MENELYFSTGIMNITSEEYEACKKRVNARLEGARKMLDDDKLTNVLRGLHAIQTRCRELENFINAVEVRPDFEWPKEEQAIDFELQDAQNALAEAYHELRNVFNAMN